MTRTAAWAAVASLAVTSLLAGCAPARTGSLGPAPTAPAVSPSGASGGVVATPPGEARPTGTRPTAPPPAQSGGTPEPSGTLSVQLWFVRSGRLAPTRHTRPATLATSRLALTELSAGPSPVEEEAGLATAFPAGVGFDISGIEDGLETVDFGPAFFTGGAQAVRLRQAQVVYTLTQFASVSRVAFRSAGRPVGEPVQRGDFADLLPPIVVLTPIIGQRVSSPVTVTGTADVFEATVSVRLLDAEGREIATAFTTATCGSGCRGRYRVAVPYRAAGAQRGTLEVYEVSARDGARTNVFAVPVTLAAAQG